MRSDERECGAPTTSNVQCKQFEDAKCLLLASSNHDVIGANACEKPSNRCITTLRSDYDKFRGNLNIRSKTVILELSVPFDTTRHSPQLNTFSIKRSVGAETGRKLFFRPCLLACSLRFGCCIFLFGGAVKSLRIAKPNFHCPIPYFQMKITPAAESDTVKRVAHRLPCTIHKDGEAPTARAYCPFPEPMPSFRGRELRHGTFDIAEDSNSALSILL